MYVVSEMTQSTGVLNYLANNDVVSRTEYGYQEAVYNNRGRGFQGFRKISVLTQPDTGNTFNRTLSESTFHQVYPIAGKLDEVTVYEYQGNNQYLLQHNKYQWSDSNLSNHSANGIQYWPMELQSSKAYAKDQTSLTGSTRSEQVTSFSANDCAGITAAYDAYGNVLCSKVITTQNVLVGPNRLGLQTTTNEVTTKNTYKQVPDTANWWVDQLLTTEVSQSMTEGGVLGSQSGDVNRDTTSVFHWQSSGLRKLQCQFTLGGGSPVSSYSSCGVAPNSDMVNKTTFTYDTYGNIIDLMSSGQTRDPINLTTADVVQNRQVETEYATLQKSYFPTKITQKSTTDLPTVNQYNAKTGQVIESKDANGVVTTNTYDAFGIMKQQEISHDQVSGTLDQITETPMQNCLTRDATNQPINLCDAARNTLVFVMTYVQNTVSAQLAGQYDLSTNTGFFFSNNSIKVPELLYKVQTRKLGAPVMTSWLDKNGQAVLTQSKHSGGTSYTVNLVNPLGQVELTTEPFSNVGFDAEYHFTLNTYDERGRLSERLTRVGDLNGGNSQCWRDTLYDTERGQTRIDAYYIGAGCDQDALGDLTNGLTMYRSYDAVGMLRETIDVNNKTTRYWYDAVGNPHVIRDAMNNDITTEYDDLGRKKKVIDLNMGDKYFTYNSFGEVIMEQDEQQFNTGLANYMHYDDLGRLINKRWNVKSDLTTDPAAVAYQDTFVYGGCGSVTAVCDQYRNSTLDNSGVFYAAQHQSFLYDHYGRLTEKKVDLIDPLEGISTLAMDDPSYRVNYDYYGAYNLLKQTTYGRSGIRDTSEDRFYSVVNEYDKYGNLTKQFRNPTNTELMRVTDFGQLRGLPTETYLNGTEKTSYEYYNSTGQLKSINHSNGQQTIDYAYDAWGNLTNQTLNGLHNEKLTYDKLQRLTSAQVGTQTAYTYAYDNGGLGNLVSKSDFSTDQRYKETNHGGPKGIAGPNAITSSMNVRGGTDDIHYIYDQKGNRIEDRADTHDGPLISSYIYDANNLLIQATKLTDSETVKYRYGADHARYLKFEDSIDDTDSIDNLEVTLWGMPGFEEVINLDTLVDQEIKLQVSDYLMVTVDELNRIKHHYMQKDRMGSTTRIIDENNIEVEVKGYDAFGKPRSGTDWSLLTHPELDFDAGDTEKIDITKRGFTGHEHIDAFELIHMNGRMYDFNNGRFLSVDPYIQGVTSQAINPYSYIQNNPLAGTDPTGYLCDRKNKEKNCNEQRHERGSPLQSNLPWRGHFARQNGISVGDAVDAVNEEISNVEDQIRKERERGKEPAGLVIHKMIHI